MSGETLFEAKVLPALEKALKSAKRHGYPFTLTLQITPGGDEEPAQFASFWYLPPEASETLREGLTAVCPGWETARKKAEGEG